MYFRHVFGIYDKYLVLIVKRIQLKTTIIPGILKIRVDAIWDAFINSRIFYQVVAIKREWFLKNLALVLKIEDKKNHQ